MGWCSVPFYALSTAGLRAMWNMLRKFGNIGVLSEAARVQLLDAGGCLPLLCVWGMTCQVPVTGY